jgi:VanZ family protein
MNNTLLSFDQKTVERLAYVTSGLLLILTTVLSLMPLDNLPEVSGSDKLHHFIAYCAIGLPISFIKFPLAVRLSPAIILYSGIIELIQPFSNRYAEWADLWVNALGVLASIFIGWLAQPTVKRLLKNAQ